MNEWYFQRALSKSFKMSPHMTILGHSPRVFVLQNIYCGCGCGCGTTPHVKKLWSCGPHDHTRTQCGLEAYFFLCTIFSIEKSQHGYGNPLDFGHYSPPPLNLVKVGIL